MRKVKKLRVWKDYSNRKRKQKRAKETKSLISSSQCRYSSSSRILIGFEIDDVVAILFVW